MLVYGTTSEPFRAVARFSFLPCPTYGEHGLRWAGRCAATVPRRRPDPSSTPSFAITTVPQYLESWPCAAVSRKARRSKSSMTVAQPTASLTWLDHDAIAADRSMRLLASLQEKEARDEFGIGAIRDAISDQLFPGVSTIQTRLRYFFFIPWLFEGLDSQGVSPAKYPQAARRAEVQLLEHLRHNAADEYGIIGRDSGASLKRLPSSVYWAGLSVWGIRQTSGSLQQYFQASAERQRYLRQREKAPLFESDGDQPLQAWHPEIIRLRPKNFPAGA